MSGANVSALCRLAFFALLLASSAGCADDESRDSDNSTDDPSDSGTDSDADAGDADTDTDTETDSETEIDWGCPDEYLVWEGKYWATNAAEIDALFGYSEIHGDLVLSGETLTSLSGLECLTHVDGNLFIGWKAWSWQGSDCYLYEDGGTGLVDVEGLLNLVSVSGSVVIAANDNLCNVDGLGSLENIGGHLQILDNQVLVSLDQPSLLQDIGGQLGIIDNYSLANLDGLMSLASIGEDLSIGQRIMPLSPSPVVDECSIGGGNHDLLNLNGLSNLESVGGGVYVTSNVSLDNVDGLSNLVSIATNPASDDDVMIAFNYSLTSIEGLGGLGPTIPGNLVIASSALSSADGLDGIEHVGGEFGIDGPISDLSALGNLVDVGSHVSIGNVMTSDLSLDSLESIGGTLTLHHDDNVIDLASLGNLASVGSLSFHYCAALTNVDGLVSLTSAGSLDINTNSSLLNLDGLSGLTSLDTGGLLINGNPSLGNIDGLQSITNVFGDIHVRDNDSLTNLDALDGLTSFSGDWFFVHENASIPTCDAIALRDLVQGFGWSSDVCVENNLADTCVDDVSGCL